MSLRGSQTLPGFGLRDEGQEALSQGLNLGTTHMACVNIGGATDPGTWAVRAQQREVEV